MNKPTPPAKLIVVIAFEDDGDGGPRPAFEPREFQSENRARTEAGSLVNTYPAVIAWSREARPDIGEYGEPEILFSFGPVPDME
jgi:hypothetical protein